MRSSLYHRNESVGTACTRHSSSEQHVSPGARIENELNEARHRQHETHAVFAACAGHGPGRGAYVSKFYSTLPESYDVIDDVT